VVYFLTGSNAVKVYLHHVARTRRCRHIILNDQLVLLFDLFTLAPLYVTSTLVYSARARF